MRCIERCPPREDDRVDDSVVLEGSLAEIGVVLDGHLQVEVFVYPSPNPRDPDEDVEVYPLSRPDLEPRMMVVKGGFSRLDTDEKIIHFTRSALEKGVVSSY